MPSVTIATFNIHSGRGLDDQVDLDRIAAAIRASGAQIVGLQELDSGLVRSGGVDQAAELARLTGLTVAFHPTISTGRGGYGIGLATAASCETRYEPLPRVGDEEPRGAVVASVGGLGVVNAHLAWQPGPRRPQIERLAAIAGSLAGPKIVVGDLNTSGRQLGSLAAAGVASPMPRRRTYVGGRRHPAAALRRYVMHRTFTRHFDHVLAGGGATIERSWTIPTTASDHVPLVAEVRY